MLAEELSALGAAVRPVGSGVAFTGSLETAYRACLWSRTASRVLLPLARVPAGDTQALYEGARSVEWERHVVATGTIAVDCTLVRSPIEHSHYAALRVKDAIVDRFRDREGCRPSVDVARPDLQVYVFVHRDRATLGLDLSGQPLHRRGYRTEGGAAPLKENLAAGLLLYAGWPDLVSRGAPFVDPMCGSGTLPIEAALIAADAAPGLRRPYFGFLGWLGHDSTLWSRLLDEAEARRSAGLERIGDIAGYDNDPRAVAAARTNAEHAGLGEKVQIERRSLVDARAAGEGNGLVLTNPPYGKRLGEQDRLVPLYACLGETLEQRFRGWRAGVFTGNGELAPVLGLAPVARHGLYNGPIECELLSFDLPAQARPDKGAEMFANRLRKNLKNLRRWAAREEISCYRVYDADMPEYAVAIDRYANDDCHLHVQEFQAPGTVDPAAAGRRLREALVSTGAVFQADWDHVHFKRRRRHRRGEQYERRDSLGRFHQVREGAYRFLVNFTDYLDTGLFLDHRPTRQLIQSLAAGRHCLNLFAYTGTATVYAAGGGALSTTSVDLSQTYLDWARRNLELNGFGGAHHRLVRSDCLGWLEHQEQIKRPRRFGLIFLDPPTFSTSKAMRQTLDVQRDHVTLIRRCMPLLERDGVLIFSNNYRRFEIDRQGLSDFRVEDITRDTIPKDFARNPRIHNCWRIVWPAP